MEYLEEKAFEMKKKTNENVAVISFEAETPYYEQSSESTLIKNKKPLNSSQNLKIFLKIGNNGNYVNY